MEAIIDPNARGLAREVKSTEAIVNALNNRKRFLSSKRITTFENLIRLLYQNQEEMVLNQEYLLKDYILLIIMAN